MWAKACKLYFANYLEGVSDISVLNLVPNASEDINYKLGYSHIHFFCGPAADQDQMKKIGYRIVIFMEYYAESGVAEFQTAKAFYERNKLDKLPMKYQIEVPRSEVDSFMYQQIW